MNKFKRKSLLMILLIIIVLVVSVFSLYSAYNIRKEKNKDNNKIVDNIKDVEKKEEEIPDTTRTYKSLDKSIAVINYLYTSLNNRVTDIYKREINISDVEKNYKIYSVLLYLYDEKNSDDILEDEYNRLYDGLYMEEKKEYYGSIRYEDVSSLYKKVYNEELGTGVEINIENYCPIFKFDSDKYFFGIYDCQIVKSKLSSYKYKYVIGEDSADVYLSLGVLENDYNFKVYKYDLYKETVYKESDTDILLDINRNNYNEYSKYIAHFVKINGDYYINSVRKVLN